MEARSESRQRLRADRAMAIREQDQMPDHLHSGRRKHDRPARNAGAPKSNAARRTHRDDAGPGALPAPGSTRGVFENRAGVPYRINQEVTQLPFLSDIRQSNSFLTSIYLRDY